MLVHDQRWRPTRSIRSTSRRRASSGAEEWPPSRRRALTRLSCRTCLALLCLLTHLLWLFLLGSVVYIRLHLVVGQSNSCCPTYTIVTGQSSAAASVKRLCWWPARERTKTPRSNVPFEQWFDGRGEIDG